MFRVMLVEDDIRLATLVTEYLVGYEFLVDVVPRGDTALEHFKATQPDIVILDLMLPGLDGMIVCRQIREISKLPILVLTAREDDFVNKPVQPRVLLARLRALIRRVQLEPSTKNNNAPLQTLSYGTLHIALSDRKVHWRKQEIDLSNTEFKLFIVLAESAGIVLSRDAILKKLRGIEFDGLDRSIDNVISRLRRRFDDTQGEKIKTVWGEGYLFSPSAWV
jgi:two-component system, OmpR family, response regulator